MSPTIARNRKPADGPGRRPGRALRALEDTTTLFEDRGLRGTIEIVVIDRAHRIDGQRNAAHIVLAQESAIISKAASRRVGFLAAVGFTIEAARAARIRPDTLAAFQHRADRRRARVDVLPDIARICVLAFPAIARDRETVDRARGAPRYAARTGLAANAIPVERATLSAIEPLTRDVVMQRDRLTHHADGIFTTQCVRESMTAARRIAVFAFIEPIKQPASAGLAPGAGLRFQPGPGRRIAGIDVLTNGAAVFEPLAPARFMTLIP